MRILPITLLMNIWLCLLKKHCNSSAHQMRMFSCLRLILLKFSDWSYLSNGGCPRKLTPGSMTIMTFCYAPLLLLTAWLDTRNARHISRNRQNNQPDDDEHDEWEELDNESDLRASDWVGKVRGAVPNVEEDFAVQQIKIARDELRDLVDRLNKAGVLKEDVTGDGKNDELDGKGIEPTPEPQRAPDAEGPGENLGLP